MTIHFLFTCSPFFQEEFEFDIPHFFHFLSFYLHEVPGDVLSKRDNVFAKVCIPLLLFCETGLLHWFTKKIKLKVVYNFLTELGVFFTTKSKNDTRFSPSGQIFL